MGIVPREWVILQKQLFSYEGSEPPKTNKGYSQFASRKLSFHLTFGF